jgi:PEP-CTERM motif
MGAKRAVLRAAAAVAVFSAVCRSTAALAAICPEVSSGAAVSCTPNDQPIDVFIYEFPVTTIYNVVNNSVSLQEIHGGVGKTINIINNTPTTTIYNLVKNSINIQIDGPAGALSGGSVDGSPITTIYNDVDNSINFSDLTGSPHFATITRIDSSPATTIYNLVDNSINVTTGPQGDSSQSAVLLTPTLQSIVIDNEAVTDLFNYVDNSINIAERISTLSGSVVTKINNDSTTNIFNVVDNTINLELSDPLGTPIALFIDSMPTTLIDNWVDNSLNLTVAAPEPSSWLLLALGFCAFGLLRRATSKRAQGAKDTLLRVTTSATSTGSDALISGLHRQLRQDCLRQDL